MNIHVPEDIKNKYPHMEFRGKIRTIKDRPVIEAYNPVTEDTFFYSFEEDFFWFAGEIPDYKLEKV
jgi:uncharacterized protein with HEPN domain